MTTLYCVMKKKEQQSICEGIFHNIFYLPMARYPIQSVLTPAVKSSKIRWSIKEASWWPVAVGCCRVWRGFRFSNLPKESHRWLTPCPMPSISHPTADRRCNFSTPSSKAQLWFWPKYSPTRDYYIWNREITDSFTKYFHSKIKRAFY